jgi:hypothetical protein
MKINDVKSRQVKEKLSDENKSDIRKIRNTGKGKVRPLIKMAQMGNKAKEAEHEKSRDPSDAINKFLANKNTNATD